MSLREQSSKCYNGVKRLFILRSMKIFKAPFICLILFLLAACETHQAIVAGIDEKEANEIVVYLASKGIQAQKVQVAAVEGGATAVLLYNIMVGADQSVDAMAILNRVGLPRRMGTNLLQLFAKSGLMSSDREETIRYQAGLAEELRNTIRKIDGVIDADVQLSFPTETAGLPGGATAKVTAAVYIKHQGILEDPNSHMEVKIKRLMAASVSGLDYDNVTVVSDRSRFTDVTLTPEGEMIGMKSMQEAYVSIWGVVMTKSSLSRFRTIFFSFIVLILLMLGAVGWVIYKFYPQMRAAILKTKETTSSGEPPLT